MVVEEGKKEVMNLHYKSFDQLEKRNESCDQMIKVKLRRMRLVFVNKFISRLTVSVCIWWFVERFVSRRVQEMS